jgi:5-methylcytosine-specific restriction protein A
MNSLKLLLSQLGSNLGIELVLNESTAEESKTFEIQMVGLNPRQTFTFILSRSWRTTQIKLLPGPFAGQFVKYLCEQLLINHEKVLAQIHTYSAEFSDLRLEIDGIKISSGRQKLSESPNLCFEGEVLTSESSLRLGLVNEKEARLIEFAITLLISVLPVVDNIFRNADEVVGFPEGAITHVSVNKYERDPRNRRLAIQLHGNSCQACDFNFNLAYGELGENYIVVHHLVPLSAMGVGYVVDPLKDLATVCANCHAMLHAKDPPLTIDELRDRLANPR